MLTVKLQSARLKTWSERVRLKNSSHYIKKSQFFSIIAFKTNHKGIGKHCNLPGFVWLEYVYSKKLSLYDEVAIFSKRKKNQKSIQLQNKTINSANVTAFLYNKMF